MKRALLADDDSVNRAFLGEALHALGWQVESFASGDSAARAAITQRFDVLLLDLNMPGMDGIQTLRHIRNLDSNASADSPALALTADPRPELHRQLIRSGFDGVATKPLSIAQLADALNGLTKPGAWSTNDDGTGHSETQLPLWDDHDALAAVGGKQETLAALRGLMLADLPRQRDTILADPMSDEARSERHRLSAACGFCGAVRLARTLRDLDCAPAGRAQDEALAMLADTINKTLQSAPS